MQTLRVNTKRKTDILIIGGTLTAVSRAIDLGKRGISVMLAVEETYLGMDALGTMDYMENRQVQEVFPAKYCCGDFLVPDQYKKYLEDACVQAEVRFCYGLYLIDQTKVDNRIKVRFGSKGGMYEIWCSQTEEYYPFADKEGISSTWVMDKETGEIRILKAAFPLDNNKSTAENYLYGQQVLLNKLEEGRAQNPNLVAGRFADRIKGLSFSQAGSNREASYGEEVFEIVVAGGGTAGAMAALYAARYGAKTVLIEPQFALGGTGTVGGVSTYWFGKRGTDVEEIDALTDELCSKYGAVRKPGIWGAGCKDDFHAGIKSFVLLQQCLKAGVTVVFGQLVYDVVKEGTGVKGVVTAGWEGNKTYYGKIMIDATGDGDLSFFAGAEAVYGSERDCITYWASLAQYTGADTYQNNFSSMVISSDPEDMTRFAYIGRRRGENTFDHGSYISMRESRHIQGQKILNLKNLCRFQTYEDGIYTCYSNYDPKGKLDADMVYCGYLPPQVSVQVPLRALIPVDKNGDTIKGLYVAGKAISATHNVFPSLRMQPDLMHQGAMLGMLSAEAIKEGVAIEELDAKKRRNWIQRASGDELILTSYKEETEGMEAYINQITSKTRTHWIDVPFTYEETEINPLLIAVCGESKEVLPCLKRRIQEWENRAVKSKEEKGEKEEVQKTLLCLKKLGLWHGCDEYTEAVTAKILSRLSGESELPVRTGSTMCAQLLPDHGVMPETVYEMNLLANSKTHSMEPFHIVLERLKHSERNYLDIKAGIYHYVEAFAYVAERNGRKEFIPMLEELLQFSEFKTALEEDEQVELLSERLQTLALILSRALARLGADAGYEGLNNLLRAPGLAVRRSAEMELAALEKSKDSEEADRLIHDKIW